MRRFTVAFSWPLLNLTWYQGQFTSLFLRWREGAWHCRVVRDHFSKALVFIADYQPCFRAWSSSSVCLILLFHCRTQDHSLIHPSGVSKPLSSLKFSKSLQSMDRFPSKLLFASCIFRGWSSWTSKTLVDFFSVAAGKNTWNYKTLLFSQLKHILLE